MLLIAATHAVFVISHRSDKTMLKSTLFAIVLALPLALSAATPSAGPTIGGAQVAPTTPSQYGCCWIFFAGRWMCFPCG